MEFLGDHQGSLVPTCRPCQVDKPHSSRAIGHSLAVQDLRSSITLAGHNGKLYSEHSCKRGGATHAANSGLIDQEIREIGNWKSLKTARLYIDHNTPLRQKRSLRLQKLI